MKNPTFETLGLAIDAIGTSDFYPAACDYVRNCMEFDNVIVVIYVGTNIPQIAYSRCWGPDVFRHLEDQYLQGAYMLDPVYHYHLQRGAPGLYRLIDIAPDQFRNSRYFKWYYGRIGISDEISVVLPVGENATITISMGKDSSSGSTFTTKAEEAVRQHEAVIISLLKRHWKALDAPAIQIARATSVVDSVRDEMRRQHGTTLSPRQAEVALLILQGHSSASMALHLGVSRQTVKVFRKQLYARCQISSQVELFALMMPMIAQAHGKNPTERMD